MKTLADVLQKYKSNPFVSEAMYNDTKEKATDHIKDGLFDHHVSFYYVDGCHCYYKDFFGNGWNKRKIDRNGFIKYQNALMMNPETKEIISRYDYNQRSN